MPVSFARTAIVLGLLAAVGPFAIDMYLPALPAIGADLGASTTAVQLSLMAYFGAIAILQLIYGPLSDRLGRKPLLYFGLTLFIVGSIGCSFAPSIELLITFRAIQGIGACASMALPLAIVRDLYTGPQAAKLFAFVMLVLSVSPILAPMAGSLIVAAGEWRLIFIVIAIAAAIILALVTFLLPETLPKAKRQNSGIRSVAVNYGTLIRDPRYVGVVMIGAFGMASFFTFIGASSFVYIDHFGVPPTAYSLLFSVNALFFIGASQFASPLAQRFGMERVIRFAVIAFLVASLVQAGLALAGVDSLPVLAVLLVFQFTPLGLIVPSAAVLALEPHGARAGTASALMGTLQFCTGAVMIGVVSALFDGTAKPMVLAIAFCSVGAFILSRLVLVRRAAAIEPAAVAEPAE